MDYKSAGQMARRWNVSQRRVQILCSENRITGAFKVGEIWVIPDNASKPVDLRIYCPTGTHAAYVASISNYSSERETILQSGSIYKVHKLENKGGKIVAYLELLGTD